MSLPTLFTVGVKAHVSGETDAHGNPVDTWSDPVDVPVYAIAPTSSVEYDPARMEVVTGLTILAPPGTVIGPYDRVVIDGNEYEVEGEIANWNKGPFDFLPGVSINVTRAEG